MTVLEPAEAQPIGADEYRTRLNLGALGQNHLRTGFTEGDQSALVASSTSSFDSPAARSVLGGFLGLLAGVGLALVRDRLDRRLRTRNEAEVAFGLPVLAEVPKFSKKEPADTRRLVLGTVARGRRRRTVRCGRRCCSSRRAASDGAERRTAPTGGPTPTLFDPAPTEPLVIMVTSAAPREGKTHHQRQPRRGLRRSRRVGA